MRIAKSTAQKLAAVDHRISALVGSLRETDDKLARDLAATKRDVRELTRRVKELAKGDT